MKNLKRILVAVVMLISAVCVSAQEQKPTGLILPSVVSDNMVLQQNETVNIWGWAKTEPHQYVSKAIVNFCKAKGEGYCRCRLGCRKAYSDQSRQGGFLDCTFGDYGCKLHPAHYRNYRR